MDDGACARYTSLVLGRRGSGKSTLLRHLALACPHPLWWYDPLHEHPVPGRGARFRPALDDAELAPSAPGWDHLQQVAARALACGGVLVADEVDLAIRPGCILPPALRRLVMHGRHYPRGTGSPCGVGFLLATRRPAECPPAIRGQVADLYLFALSESRDVQWAADAGADPRSVRRLRRGQFLHIHEGGQPHLHDGPYTVCQGVSL